MFASLTQKLSSGPAERTSDVHRSSQATVEQARLLQQGGPALLTRSESTMDDEAGARLSKGSTGEPSWNFSKVPIPYASLSTPMAPAPLAPRLDHVQKDAGSNNGLEKIAGGPQAAGLDATTEETPILPDAPGVPGKIWAPVDPIPLNQAGAARLPRSRPAISASLVVNQPGDQLLVQRSCGCHGSGGTEAPCEECARKQQVQTKLLIGSPDDEFEAEADRVAEHVMRMSSTESPVEKREDAVQAELEGSALQIQRQEDDTGEEEERPDDVASEDEDLQLQRAEGVLSPSLDEEDLRQERGSGVPLPHGFRSFAEQALGADFRSVRVHYDARADEMSRSLGALAFTNRADIFFRTGRYDPGSQTGKRLLAHELTHVVQQNPGVRSDSRALASPNVQRDSDESGTQASHVIGEVHLYAKDGKEISWMTLSYAGSLPPGGYQATITGTSGSYKMAISGVVTKGFEPNDEKFAGFLRSAATILVFIYNPQKGFLRDDDKSKPGAGGEGDEGKPGAAEPKAKEGAGAPGASGPGAPVPAAGGPETKSSEGETKTAGPQPEKDAVHGHPQDPNAKPGQDATPAPTEGKKAEDSPDTEGADSGPEAKKGRADADPTGSGGLGGGTEAKSTGGGIPVGTKGGSKYGWLGLIHPPQFLVDVLDAAVEALGDSEELLELRDVLQLITELADHADEITSWFEDSDKLIAVALGVEDNAAITALETWVSKPVPKRKKSSGGGAKSGLVRMALKVASLVDKIHLLLKPVFKVRSAFQSVLGVVGELVEEVPQLEMLLGGLGGDTNAPGFTDLLEQAGGDLAEKIQAGLMGARKSMELKVIQFLEADFITTEEIAAVVTDAIPMLTPKQYRPMVWVLRRIPGLEDLVREHMVEPMIPHEAADALNGALHWITKLVEPAIKEGIAKIDDVIQASEQGLRDFLVPELKSILVQPSFRTGVRLAKQPDARALGFHLRTSSGAALPPEIGQWMGESMGFDFGRVRVHHDAAAQRATDSIQANAFTVGTHIFFGPGQYRPSTEPGQYLLAHELTHVVQQSGGAAPAFIQRDYKSLVTKLAKTFGPKALEGLRQIKATSPANRAKAQQMKEEVAKLIGKKVSPKSGPPLPEAYVYVRDKRSNKIVSIRRKLKWIASVDALTIEKKTRVIKFGFQISSYDPDAAARRQLRRALGCNDKQEAHHVIPLELRQEPPVPLAERNGFAFNGAVNGICLSVNIHSGSHGQYTNGVREELRFLVQQFGRTDWKNMGPPFFSTVGRLQGELAKGRKKLK